MTAPTCDNKLIIYSDLGMELSEECDLPYGHEGKHYCETMFDGKTSWLIWE